MMIMLTKPYDCDADTDDGNEHKNDSSTAAGAASGASVPCSWLEYLQIYSHGSCFCHETTVLLTS